MSSCWWRRVIITHCVSGVEDIHTQNWWMEKCHHNYILYCPCQNSLIGCIWASCITCAQLMYWPINVQIVNLVYAVTLGSMSQLCHMLDAKLMISPSQLHVAHCHPTMLILLHAPSHSAPCPCLQQKHYSRDCRSLATSIANSWKPQLIYCVQIKRVCYLRRAKQSNLYVVNYNCVFLCLACLLQDFCNLL